MAIHLERASVSQAGPLSRVEMDEGPTAAARAMSIRGAHAPRPCSFRIAGFGSSNVSLIGSCTSTVPIDGGQGIKSLCSGRTHLAFSFGRASIVPAPHEAYETNVQSLHCL